MEFTYNIVLRASNGDFMSAASPAKGSVRADRPKIGASEQFTLLRSQYYAGPSNHAGFVPTFKPPEFRGLLIFQISTSDNTRPPPPKACYPRATNFRPIKLLSFRGYFLRCQRAFRKAFNLPVAGDFLSNRSQKTPLMQFLTVPKVYHGPYRFLE